MIQTSLAALGLSACSASLLGQTRAPKRVAVIGAGLAGLVAAYELTQAGHDVSILEARARAGGRVYTLREPFSDGLRADAGAFFIPDVHDLTLKYARLFELPLELVPPRRTGTLYYVRGRRFLLTSNAKVSWPVDLTPEEERLGISGMWRTYINSAFADLGDVTAPDWPPPQVLEQYDRMSLADLLRVRGESPGAIELFALDANLGDLGEGIASYSALRILHELARLQQQKNVYTIGGGNDLLPKAFAARLKDRIQYGAPVVRLEPGERSVGIVTLAQGESRRVTADYAICAIPFSVLRRVEISPPFSPQKRAAIAELPYTSLTRVFFQVRKRFWLDEALPGGAITDLPVRCVWEPTMNQAGPRGILASDSGGPLALRIAAMAETDRTRVLVEEMEKVYPGMREHFEVGFMKSWDEDEWARGAYPWFKPGQMTSLLPHIARPEGRVHFAGEHASPWTGWMQGALESGLRAAREVNEASRQS